MIRAPAIREENWGEKPRFAAYSVITPAVWRAWARSAKLVPPADGPKRSEADLQPAARGVSGLKREQSEMHGAHQPSWR